MEIIFNYNTYIMVKITKIVNKYIFNLIIKYEK